MPSNCSRSPKATNAPAPISPTISPVEHRVAIAGLEQLALEQEAAGDVVGVALDRHRLALAGRGPRPGVRHPRGLRRRLAGDRRQQPAVADQVRVAPDRRGEVAVARRRQPGVAEVARVVVGLLERAQHQAGQRPAAAPGPRAPSRRPAPTPRRPRRPPAGGSCARGPAGSARPAMRADRSAAPPPARRAARARGTASGSCGLTETGPPARWRRSSGARSAGGTRSAPRPRRPRRCRRGRS